MVEQFSDPEGGFFDTRRDHETLITRPKDLQDNATPSGNALAAMALLEMAAFTGQEDWRKRAEASLQSLQNLTTHHPTAFSFWLSAIDFALGPTQAVAILSKPDDSGRQMLSAAIWNTYRPNLVAAISMFPPEAGSPALILERPLLNDQATAYVCQNFFCQQPVNKLEELLSQLD